MFNNTFALLRPMWHVVTLSAVAGVLSGLLLAYVIGLIIEWITDGGHSLSLSVKIIFVITVIIGGRFVADYLSGYIGQRIIKSLRRTLTATILAAPLLAIERLKQERFLSTIANDINAISNYTFSLSSVVISAAICIGALLYIASLDLVSGIVVFVIVGGTLYVIIRVQASAMSFYSAARHLLDEFHSIFISVVEGAKEIKLNRAARKTIRDRIDSDLLDKISENNVYAQKRFAYINTVNNASFLFGALVIGAVAYHRELPDSISVTVILVFFFMKAAAEQVVSYFPVSGNARVAWTRVNQLYDDLSTTNITDHEGEELLPTKKGTIKLKDVTFRYPGRDDFYLGPISVEFKPGRSYFIIGPNGAGKTTLIKLLLGLYKPSSGEMTFAERKVDDRNVDSYRQLFATVLSDFHIFPDEVSEETKDRQQYIELLEEFGLPVNVIISGDAGVTGQLSTGQRKRLALVKALAQRRPYLVFDEWAAEQDPYFKELFYRKIVPKYHALGVTIIAITHDREFFDTADAVLYVEDGRLRSAPDVVDD